MWPEGAEPVAITTQWVLFRTSEASLLRSPLPSATSVGEGWRGIQLRLFMPLDQLDTLVEETAAKTESTIGIAVVASEVGYAIVAGRGGAAARLVLEAKSAEPGAEVLHHAGIDMDDFDEWCSRAGDAVAAWSELCPERADADRVRAILEKGYDATENAVTELLGLLGLRLPEEGSPSSVDLQGEFKANAPDDPQKRGLFRRKRA
jgi:hypothetical protein